MAVMAWFVCFDVLLGSLDTMLARHSKRLAESGVRTVAAVMT